MYTCKDCIHNVICSADAFFKTIEGAEKNCVHFKVDNTKEIDEIYTYLFTVLKQEHLVRSHIDDLHDMLVNMLGMLKKL